MPFLPSIEAFFGRRNDAVDGTRTLRRAAVSGLSRSVILKRALLRLAALKQNLY